MSILGLMNDASEIKDPIIASNMVASTAAFANAYLNAALGCTTPELKAVFSSQVSEMLLENSAITELSINRNWIKPYDPPAQQLKDSFNQCFNVQPQ
jgi:spore coat protein CotF